MKHWIASLYKGNKFMCFLPIPICSKILRIKIKSFYVKAFLISTKVRPKRVSIYMVKELFPLHLPLVTFLANLRKALVIFCYMYVFRTVSALASPYEAIFHIIYGAISNYHHSIMPFSKCIKTYKSSNNRESIVYTIDLI